MSKKSSTNTTLLAIGVGSLTIGVVSIVYLLYRAEKNVEAVVSEFLKED